MTVKKLIEVLSKYPPNREVKIHNGFVDDWQDIKVTETELERMKSEYLLEIINWQREEHNEEPINKNVKAEWEYIYSSDREPEIQKNFETKSIVLIQGKFKGKTHADRLGKLRY